jgi:hypothetical protein
VRKIISLFRRNYDGDRLARDEVVPGAEWVIEGEGVATRKMDGTCCLVRGGRLYKRHEVGKGKRPPHGFEPAGDVDPNTGKQQGWVPVGDGPEDRWHREAWEDLNSLAGVMLPGGPGRLPGEYDGTYELCGPKVQGNPEGFDSHALVRHGAWGLPDCPREFGPLRDYLAARDIEGVVWHHPDGRMVKIKAKDFGIRRGS